MKKVTIPDEVLFKQEKKIKPDLNRINGENDKIIREVNFKRESRAINKIKTNDRLKTELESIVLKGSKSAVEIIKDWMQDKRVK